MVEDDEPSFQRLGKRELGRYASEECMPSSIARALAEESDENKISNVILKLAQLLEADEDVETSFLCDPSVVQVTKLANEGNTFCGYRNIQMLLSTLHARRPTLEQEHLTVLQLQELTENAWDAGFNNHGRVQTGGVKGTRKYIGTSEAEAVLLYHDIPCTGHVFSGKQPDIDLLDYVERYFSAHRNPSTSVSTDISARAQITARPPIFLQRPRHSVTIVGLEKLKSSKRRLLVFDPAWQAPSVMRQPASLAKPLVESNWSRAVILWKYRKPRQYLRRFSAFEIVSVDMVGKE